MNDELQYRVIVENAKAFDYAFETNGVSFWMGEGAIVFPDPERQAKNGFTPVIIRAEYQVWMHTGDIEVVAQAEEDRV